MQREGLSVAREPLVMYVRLINMVTITIVLGLVYVRTELSSQTIQNIIGWLFQMTRYMNFQFVFGCITVSFDCFHVSMSFSWPLLPVKIDDL